MIRCGILLAAFAASVGCARENADFQHRPTILLVALDTVRADRVSPTIMPRLTEWASDAMVYANARSPAPFTLPAMASVMTGRYPHEVGIGSHTRSDRLSTDAPLLAEIARATGYETAAVVTNPWVASAESGFARGFDRFVTGRSRGGERARMGAEEVAAEAIAILRAKRTRPLFLWLHFMDAHMPYGASPPSSAIARDFVAGPVERSRLFFEAPYAEEEIRAMRSAYDGAVTRIDIALAPVLDALGPDAVVVVLADHGESLGEHGLHFAHDFTLYDELLRVPLIVKTPDGRKGRHDGFVSLLDVAPSVCALARLDCWQPFDGLPLPGLGDDPHRDDSERALFAASTPARKRYLCPWLTVPGLEGRWTAAIVGGRKLIRMPTPDGPAFRAFDLVADPRELVDRYDASVDAPLARRLEAWSAKAAAIDNRSTAVPSASDGVTRELEELGYLE